MFLLNSNNPPVPYTSQRNVWFDFQVTLWWLKQVFLPAAQQKYGNLPFVLLLDNCPAYGFG